MIIVPSEPMKMIFNGVDPVKASTLSDSMEISSLVNAYD